ncbi:hypothetical protein PROFUN_15760, partial [Planoprotostelium fungivorum]
IECADQLAFARMPGTPFVKSLQITSEATLILDKSVDVKKITIDGLPLDVSQVSQIQRVTEDDLSSLLQFIETNVKQLMVIGNEPSRIEKILSWVEAVSRSLSTTDEQEQEEVSYHKASTILRRKNLLKELRSTKQSAVQRLLQLGNMSKVANLNSKMQADFLRGVQDGAQGRALARRHTKMGEVDYDAAITKELTALYNGTNLQENRDDLSSFYSLDTPSSCINGLHDFTMNELSLLSTADVLQLVGPLGVTFRANLADAPDPWACFFAHQVYTGESRLLNSADLWTSRTQSGENHEAILKAPGSQDTITGVLPLRSLAPDAFDRLYKLAPTLLSLHVSASLRGSLVPMPGDHAAMATSCAVRMAQQLREQPSTASAQTLLYILKDICETFQQKDMGLKREVIDLLNGNDPRVAMAGDLFIASDLKPHAAVLRGTVNRSSKLARAVVGYNMYLSCGRRFSTPEERAAEIARLLQFSEANETSAGAPNTVDPDVEKVWDTYDGAFLAGQIGVDHLNTLRCVWAVRVAYEKTGGQAEAFLNEFKYQAEEMQNLSILSVNDQHEMKCVLSALYIQALRSPNLASRISVDEATGSREYKLPDVTNVGEAEAYIRGVVREHYAAKLSQKLKAKREAERQALIDILEKELIAASTGEEFVKLLHSVDGQNKPLFPLREGQLWQNVTAAMLDTGREVPVRTDKLWVLILGRNMQGKPVWCQGNTLRADLKPYMRVFEQMKKENKWEALREIHKKYSLHIYRSHGKNRHGHSNEFPSWWARGYATLDAFQKAEPEEAERYIQERLKAGHLWANPNGGELRMFVHFHSVRCISKLNTARHCHRSSSREQRILRRQCRLQLADRRSMPESRSAGRDELENE